MSALARIKPGNPYLRGWLSPVDLLELTSLVAFDYANIIDLFYKTTYLYEEVSCTLQLVFPDKTQYLLRVASNLNTSTSYHTQVKINTLL
jgi:hypothetical protein